MTPERLSEDSDVASATPTFVEAAEPVLVRLQTALMALIQAVPGAIDTAADLRRLLDLDTRLSTQLVRVARAANPLQVANHVPSSLSVRRFCDKARSAGVPAQLCAALLAAMNDFEALVRQHGGDRVSFDSLITHLGAHGAAAIQLHHTRAAFHALSHLLGVQLEAYTRTCIITRSKTTGALELAQVRGFVGVRRLRPNTPVQLFSSQLLFTGADHPAEGHTRRPVFSELHPGIGLSLVPSVGFNPGRDIHVWEDNGNAMVELCGDHLGASGERDIYVAQLDTDVTVSDNSGSHPLGLNQPILVPARRIMLEVLLGEGTEIAGDPEAFVFPQRMGRYAMSFRPEDRLPIHCSVHRLWNLDSYAVETEFQTHSQAVRTVVEQLALGSRLRSGFRMLLDYPIVGTTVRLGIPSFVSSLKH